MNSCVESGFIKLDIFGEQTVDRDLIKNAILSLIRQHHCPLMKQSLTTSLRDLNMSSTLMEFDRKRFQKCLLSSLHLNINQASMQNISQLGGQTPTTP